MIGAGGIGAGGWLCFSAAAICTAGIVHVAPGIWARYMAVYGAPKCAPGVTCVIPKSEWQPGGLFYHGGYAVPANAMALGFGFGGAAGFAAGGSGGAPENCRRHKHHRPEAPTTPVAIPVDTGPDVGAAPLFSPPVLVPVVFAPSPGVPTSIVPPATPPTPVPEPATWGVFAVALGALAWARRVVRGQASMQATK